MPLFHIPLKDITDADLNQLIGVSESRQIEFKYVGDKGIPLSDTKIDSKHFSEKIEFLLDICQFANSSGGDIIYGVADKGGKAVHLSGFGVDDDKEDPYWRQIESILNSGIRPKIRFDHRWFKLENGKKILLIRVNPSWSTLSSVSDHLV